MAVSFPAFNVVPVVVVVVVTSFVMVKPPIA